MTIKADRLVLYLLPAVFLLGALLFFRPSRVPEPPVKDQWFRLAAKERNSRSISRGTGQRWREITMIATAYTAGPESTGKRPGDPGYGITASGAVVGPGTVAADPQIPFGTPLWIEGYGFGVVLDRGSAIRGNRLDLYFQSLEDALAWGVKRVKVIILGDLPGGENSGAANSDYGRSAKEN